MSLTHDGAGLVLGDAGSVFCSTRVTCAFTWVTRAQRPFADDLR
ncbi:MULTISPECIES: hypothetical protein [Catenuloplanes]|uniref:Uncharacterized protein n=1 Tax=Catenuloplanes niger TaxID=587534 RepID=A0AAE4CWT9_9ACTN|nr:hypothetical protein [Catenuloplanes niger]MDR7326787.1 hypothetical protein [Catenuloplanes niger]